MNRIMTIDCPVKGWLYAALQTETGFWFHRMEAGENFLYDSFKRRPNDIVIDHSQILSKRLTMYIQMLGDSCGSIRIYTADQTCHEFFIVGKHPVAELRRFFRLSDDEIELPERYLAYGKSLPRNEKKKGIYLWLYLLCFALDLALLLGAAFLPYRTWLILGLAALLTPFALALLFPAWYTLTRLEDDSARVYGKHMFRLFFLPFIPTFLLLLRLPQITYFSDPRVIFIAVLPPVLISIVVWILSPERKAKTNGLAAVLAFWSILGCGIGLVINAEDYYSNPPARIETCPISALECEKNSSSQACYVTASTSDGEVRFRIDDEIYDTLDVGDPIKVSVYDGTLGVPFACLYEYGWFP